MDEFVLVGGLHNGERVLLKQPMEEYRAPIFKNVASEVITTGLPDKSDVSDLNYESYYLQGVQGQKKTFVFYKHEAITIDEAFELLIAHYARPARMVKK